MHIFILTSLCAVIFASPGTLEEVKVGQSVNLTIKYSKHLQEIIKITGGVVTKWTDFEYHICEREDGMNYVSNVQSVEDCAHMVKGNGWYWFSYTPSKKLCLPAKKCGEVTKLETDWTIYSVTYDREDFARPMDQFVPYHNSECTGTPIDYFDSEVSGYGTYDTSWDCKQVCWEQDQCLGFTEYMIAGMNAVQCQFYQGKLWKKNFDGRHGTVTCQAKKQPCQCSGKKNGHGHGSAACSTTGHKEGYEWCYVSPWSSCPAPTVHGAENMPWSEEACPNVGKDLCKCSGRKVNGNGGPECKVDGHANRNTQGKLETGLPWCYVGAQSSCVDRTGSGDNSWSERACGVTAETVPEGGWLEYYSYLGNVEHSHHCRFKHPGLLGFQKGCCRPEYPCPEHTGDCQKDADCLPGLKCTFKQGWGGYPPGTNVCLSKKYQEELSIGKAQEATHIVMNLDTLRNKVPNATLLFFALVGFCVTFYYVYRTLFHRKVAYTEIEI